MLNNPVRRRKWSFEKGRNSSSVIYAVIATALVCAAVLWLFRYDYRPVHDTRQNAAISLIGEERVDFLQVLDLHDPALSYLINDGGFPFCLTCRRSHHPQSCPGVSEEFKISSKVDFAADIPQYPVLIAPQILPETILPPSVKYAGILPEPAEVIRHSVPVLVDQRGREIPLKQLETLPGAGKKALTINLAGDNLLMVSRIISSSGDAVLDRKAANILKAAALPAGSYTIYWQNPGGGK